MEMIKRRLHEDYQLSNYQIAQLEYLFKTVTSELSKMIIMGILFHDRLGLYFFALFVMLFLRTSTGGLHFYTYTQCLAASILYLWLGIVVLAGIQLPSYIQTLFLLICMTTCYFIGPVVSKYRPNPTPESFKRFRNITCTFIFIFSLILYIMPAHPYMLAGFWIVILHSFQLLVAKIRKKGEMQNA